MKSSRIPKGAERPGKSSARGRVSDRTGRGGGKRMGGGDWREIESQSEFLGGLMHASSQPIVIGYWDGRLGLLNKAFEELTGYTAEELRSIRWDTTLTPPEWRDVERQKLKEQLITKRAIRYEKEYIRKDGTRVPVELLVHLVPDSDGNPKFYYTFLTDITERKRAQEMLRKSDARWNAAIDNLREGVIIATAAGEVNYWNPSAQAMHGLARQEEGFGPLPSFTNRFNLVEPETGRILPLEEWPMPRIMRGETVRNLEIQLRRPDQGWERFVSYSGTMLETIKGEQLVFLSVFDLTDRKRAEDALIESGKRKDEFLAMLSHELRSPLAAIRHAVELTKESPDDAETRKWAGDVIDRQSFQLSRMVNDLLDVARITRGRIELKKERAALDWILNNAIAAAQPLFAQKRHQFSFEIEEGFEVMGDSIRLEQVFVNILNNASKYTPEDGRICLSARAEDGNAVVSIVDNGIGISGELLPHIFDLFRQAELSLDRAEGGLGIGLTVVKALVEMHDGRVVVESKGAREGTTVTVYLPLAGGVEGKKVRIEKRPAGFSKVLRVLVVDDHLDAARAMSRLLARRGCEVRVAHDGVEGMAVASEFKPEALVLDLGLPGMDGYEMARRLREMEGSAHALFIAVSGYADDNDRQRALDAGFDYHFAKPVEMEALEGAIRTGVEGRGEG